MMDWLQALALAIIQGLTEFLPISSSAHLLIPSQVFGWPDQGLAFDVAVHVGTLAAVLYYYRRDLVELATAWLRSLAGGGSNEASRTVWYLGLATIPAGLVGLLAGDFIESHLRTALVMAITTGLFGVLLGFADRFAQSGQRRALTLPVALAIGAAQALAPIPGVSRSGVTMTAALFLGLSRQEAARFSFLLSIPIITAAGLLLSLKLAAQPQPVDWQLLCVSAATAAITAYSCIALFLRLLDRVGFMPFVVYRLLLAGLLFVIWLS
jgi:undecaprenyl-diphosphatase